MKKFWQLVSKKHLIFGLVLFAAVLLISFLERDILVKVEFNDADFFVESRLYTMRISYDEIESAQLTDLAEAGEVVDGGDNLSIRYGVWENGTWGKYTICADLNTTNCIVLKLTDGQTYVFSRKNIAETEEIYQELLTHIG